MLLSQITTKTQAGKLLMMENILLDCTKNFASFYEHEKTIITRHRGISLYMKMP